jgi:chitin disaccharide deacetylase
MKMYFSILSFCLLWISFAATGQQRLLQKLGYTDSDKLLIIHADDIGLSHSENLATIQSMTAGVVNSTSIMMPCAWSTEVGELIRDYPKLDIGVHITLTNEWFTYKWGPISDAKGLRNDQGFMYADCASVAESATPEDVEKEMRAQIEAALAIGIVPTHLDSHMGCVFYGRPDYLASYLKLAQEYQLPAMLTPEMVNGIIKVNPELFAFVDVDNLPIINYIHSASPAAYDQMGMAGYYNNLLANLQPGITVLLIHVAYDDAEMKGVTVRHPYWNSPWRQADFDYFTSQKAKEMIDSNNIKLVTWREIGTAMQQP